MSTTEFGAKLIPSTQGAFVRSKPIFALGVFLGAIVCIGQQVALQSTPPSARTTSETVYYAGPGVTPPEPVPLLLADPATGRCKHVDSAAVLSAIVDADGMPHNVYLLKPAGNELDDIAIKVIMAERFKPGMHGGTPAATIVAIELHMKACIEVKKDDAGQKAYTLALRFPPGQKLDLQQPQYEGATLALNNTASWLWESDSASPLQVGREISPPEALKTVDAEYSDTARKARISGVCVVSLIVDAHGMPRQLRVTKNLEPSLDQNALYAVSRYRFKPAMKKDGTPVPVMIRVQTDFHLY